MEINSNPVFCAAFLRRSYPVVTLCILNFIGFPRNRVRILPGYINVCIAKQGSSLQSNCTCVLCHHMFGKALGGILLKRNAQPPRQLLLVCVNTSRNNCFPDGLEWKLKQYICSWTSHGNWLANLWLSLDCCLIF